jgi:hypothetical protein
MKSRTTLILVVLVVIVGIVVVWDHYRGTSTEEAAEKGKHILSFKSDDVTRLELAHTNQTIVLEKSGDKWDIKQPLSVRADGSAVNSILSDLEFAQRDRALSEKELQGANLADFGLDHPAIRVTLQGKKGPLTLLVGRETPTKDAVYVQLQGQKQIDITPKWLVDRLNTGLDNLRSHVAVEFTSSAATRLELKSADRVIELAKTAARTNAEPRWAIVHPLAVRADQSKVSELLTDLSDLRIQDFVSEDPKDVHTHQLDDPEREVTAWTGDAGKTLLIGPALTNDPGKVYAKLKSADSIFTVSAEQAKKFAVQINDLRDRQVLAFSQPGVRGIELVRGGEKTVLTRTNTGWNVTSPVTIAAEESRVTSFLDKLGDLHAMQFTADVATDLDRYGLAAPITTITLLGDGTNMLAQFLIGGSGESNAVRCVKRGDEPFIYGVETNIVEWLPAGPLALRVRRLVELKPDQITKLTAQSANSHVALERGTDGKWKLTEPSQGVLDNDALNSLLDAFTQLRAVDFVRQGRDDLTEYRLDAPEFTVTAQTRDKIYSLGLGKSAEGGLQYALWSDPPLVVTVATAELGSITKQIVTATPSVATSTATNAAGAVEIATPPSAAVSTTDAVHAATNAAPVTTPPR